ncbi:glycosyltransferase [Prevotella denticola]|uniref:glycosyltransferase n=1 Tax=Prevotella denticola TaxID=28129 RepID=UPI001C5E4F9B|nr:glycosyltransferase family 1 protein [Prevotella denticola]MBW4715365.1 glycosyltransferase family 1 protein [Prevotella denticola]MBW4753233.1 glycosyltransferase family 1 protein [Prevotella denticola]
MKVYIDPRTEYRYTSFYRLGLYNLFGKNNILYSVKPFEDLMITNANQYGCGMEVVFDNEYGKITKVYFDIKDVAEIEKDKYDWCDIYSKVNIKFGDLEKYDKLFVPGPNFAIRNRSLIGLLTFGLKNFLRGKASSFQSLKGFMRDYFYIYVRRRSMKFYERYVEVKPNYIFHASTLWYNKFAATDTNMYRGEFLKACKKAGINIEGGLFYVNGESVLKEMPDYPKYKEEYKDFIYENRLSMDDYIRKTKESVVVFNTPSVCECHGWKLGEYLCMGKAIISSPLLREMPGEGLIHGKNIHIVNSPEDIYDAVVRINSDEHYRKQLEEGARKYYDQWIAPEVVIQRLLEKIGEQP